MKKNKKQPPKPTRQDWKNEAENEIVLLLEDIDTLDLPKDTVLAIEREIAKFKVRLNEAIDLFEVTPEIAVQTDDFLENILDQVYFNKIVAGEYDIDRMQDIVISNRNGLFIHTDSLVQEMKVEAFIQELQENPYQLKLIA